MKYFIVHAHPELRSLSGYLKDRAVDALMGVGHDVVVSDLCTMRWKAVAYGDDFPARRGDEGPLTYGAASRRAFAVDPALMPADRHPHVREG